MRRPSIAILASGEGTTAEAVVIASAENKVSYSVGLVIASNEDAGILKRIATLNNKYDLRILCIVAHNDELIDTALASHQPDVVALMGYMKMIGPELVHKYGWRSEYTAPEQARLVNTHPGLLPETKGLYGIHVQNHVLDNQLEFGGQTLHVVSERYDEGPVVVDHRVPVEHGDTAETLFERVKIVEKQYLPYDIEEFINKRLAYLESK